MERVTRVEPPQLKASNELCSFAARLMETSGDLGRSLAVSVFMCVCVVFSPRGEHTLQHLNGYLWDLIPGTSAALQVYRHHFLLFLHLFPPSTAFSSSFLRKTVSSLTNLS